MKSLERDNLQDNLGGPSPGLAAYARVTDHASTSSIKKPAYELTRHPRTNAPICPGPGVTLANHCLYAEMGHRHSAKLALVTDPMQKKQT